MKSILIGGNSSIDNEKSNFNIFPLKTPSLENKSSNNVSSLNTSAAPNIYKNSDFDDVKQSQKKNYSINNIEKDLNNKNYTSDINNKEENLQNIFNNDTNNNKSILDDGQLLIDSVNFGFIPFFIKLEDYDPLYFIANKETIFKNILKRYITDNGNININNYIFYNNGEIIDKNLSLENLNILPLSIIIGKKEWL